MPIFEYRCADCGTMFEKIVRNTSTVIECTQCNSRKVEKQLSVFAVAGPSGPDVAADPGCGRCGAPRPGSCGLD